MNLEYKKLLEDVCKNLEQKNIKDADLILQTGTSYSLSPQQQKIEKISIAGQRVLGIRVINQNKVGLSYTEDLSPEGIKYMIDSAIELAQNSKENFNEEVANREKSIAQIENAHKMVKLETKDLEALALKLESHTLKLDKRIKLAPSIRLSMIESNYYYANTHGVFRYSDDAYYSLMTSALMEENEKKSVHYVGRQSRQLGDDLLVEMASECVSHAAQWLDGEKIPTGKYDVVFDIDALSDIFGVFQGVFSSKAKLEGRNPWSDKREMKVWDESISIKDCPTYQDAFFQYPFDGEGYAHENLSLVDKGLLKNFYSNSVTAKTLKIPHTKHGAKGAKGALGVSGTNIVIKTTKQSSDVVSDYLEIISMQGLHSGSNFTTGDFSCAINGYLVKNGQRALPVKGVTIAGNFYQMIQDIDVIDDKICASTGKDFFAPILKFKKLSVAGR